MITDLNEKRTKQSNKKNVPITRTCQESKVSVDIEKNKSGIAKKVRDYQKCRRQLSDFCKDAQEGKTQQ